MQGNADMLEKIKEDFAIKNGISVDEASLVIDNAIKGLRISLVKAIEVIADAWKAIRRIAEWLCGGWDVNWDTRRGSLVISNRPRFVVRKII